MPNTEDAVMPILRNIQAELAEVKRSVQRVESKVDTAADRMESFEGYLAYEMGRTTRGELDIKKLQGDFRALRDRVDDLEPQT
jgi:predicted nuclease with TOPRIM domain